VLMKRSVLLMLRMSTEMMELFDGLTGFHEWYDVEYNAGRFEGYLGVLEEKLERLERGIE
jgi:hypothetical protein